MVSGLLPVVGVPLPLVSYGGTALVSLFIGLGILMSVQAHRKLGQHLALCVVGRQAYQTRYVAMPSSATAQ